MYDRPSLDIEVISAHVASVLREETLQTSQTVAKLIFLKERTFFLPSAGFAQYSCLLFLNHLCIHSVF